MGDDEADGHADRHQGDGERGTEGSGVHGHRLLERGLLGPFSAVPSPADPVEDR